MKSTSTPKYRVTMYLLCLLVFTVIGLFLTSNMESSPLTGLIIMWSPGLAALTASLITRRSLKEIGWNPLPVKWLLISWLIPILYAAAAYLPLWMSGLGGIPNPTFLERARLTLNMPGSSDLTVIVSAFFFITIVNLIPALIPSIGEEIGWRGFLLPELNKWMGGKSAALLSGMIWFVWHLPGILVGGYETQGTPKLYQILCFGIMVVSSAVIFSWVRLKSGNVWTAAILHATHNGAIQAFFDRITFDTSVTSYFAGEFGLALSITQLLLAIYLWNRLEEPQPLSQPVTVLA